MGSSEQGRGMMPPSQRALLTGDQTDTGSTKRGKRSKLRTNVRSALRDLPLLFTHLRGEAFEELIYPDQSDPIDRETIVAGIAFLYKAAATHPGLDPATVLHDGVELAEFHMGRDASVDVETEPIDAMAYCTELQREGLVETLPEAFALLQTETFDRRADDPMSEQYGQPAAPYYRAALEADPEEQPRDTRSE